MKDLDSSGWLQLNVGLIRTNGSAYDSARSLFDTITPFVERWREDGWLSCYFLMRKPPDIRLRFFSTDCKLMIKSVLAQELEVLLKLGTISEFFFSNYAPEINRFGGVEAMNAVHNYFDVDTHNWLALDNLARLEQSEIDPAQLLPSLFQNLFDRVLDDKISVLKTWQHLAELTPLDESVELLTLIDLLEIDRLSDSTTILPETSNILKSYRQAHDQLGEEFSQLWQADLLCADLYEILAAIALFSFNRHGFAGERSAPIVEVVIRDLRKM